MPVTITAIDTIQLSIPLDTWAPPPLFAGKPRTHVEALYVRVTTSSGVVGWGESFGSSGTLVGAAFDRWIRGLAVGKDPTDSNLMPGIERLSIREDVAELLEVAACQADEAKLAAIVG